MARDEMICGRHGGVIPSDDEREFCWYCEGNLCYDCWDKFGDCGHLEVKEFYLETERRIKNELPRMKIPSA